MNPSKNEGGEFWGVKGGEFDGWCLGIGCNSGRGSAGIACVKDCHICILLTMAIKTPYV